MDLGFIPKPLQKMLLKKLISFFAEKDLEYLIIKPSPDNSDLQIIAPGEMLLITKEEKEYFMSLQREYFDLLNKSLKTSE